MNKDTIYKIFTNIPELTSKRLLLRKMKKSDYHDMFEYSKLPEVTKYLTWDPHPDEDYTYRYLDYISSRYKLGDFYDWAVISIQNNKMIGTCGFTRFDVANNCAEIGYVLNPAYWGNQYATEAAKLVINFGFMQLNIHRIEARFIEGNNRSRRVMEKCGMQYEGTHRSSLYVNREYKNIGYCSILSNEYIEKFM